jgi:hypothetical protein
MKTFVSIISVFIVLVQLSAQMTFTSIGSEDAFCRINGSQSGDGQVFCAVAGGAPPYSYLWVNLTNAQTSTNTVWTGLNPGNYKITVTDANSAVLIDTVKVDSVNPIANFAATGPDISGGGVLYFGIAPTTVTFQNLSTGLGSSSPIPQFQCVWQFTQFESWDTIQSLIDQNYAYNFSGYWGVSLAVENQNGCVDTAYVQIGLDGPSGFFEKQKELVIFNSHDQLKIYCGGNNNPKTLKIYDLSGKMVCLKSFSGENASFSWNYGQGIFLYELFDPTINEVLKKGRFIF